MKRILSIDVFRGFDMLFIMGFSIFVTKFCVACGWGADCWLARQMHHVEWDGLHIYDLVYPTFLFIAGMSFPFSRASQEAKGKTAGAVARRVVVRALKLVGLGLLYVGILKTKDYSTMHYTSVLARIGLAWGLAALLALAVRAWRPRVLLLVAVLTGYAFLCRFVGAPDHPEASPLSMAGSLAGWIDRLLLPGTLRYDGIFEPEGLLPIVTATVTASFGILAGEILRSRDGVQDTRKTLSLAAFAATLLAAGYAFSFLVPVNKALWSSSFACVAGGCSLGVYAFFHWIIDVKGWTRWTFFFKVIGVNAIVVYMLGPMFYYEPGGLGNATRFFLGALCSHVPTAIGEAIFQGGYVLVNWLVLLFLYRKNVFIKV